MYELRESQSSLLLHGHPRGHHHFIPGASASPNSRHSHNRTTTDTVGSSRIVGGLMPERIRRGSKSASQDSMALLPHHNQHNQGSKVKTPVIHKALASESGTINLMTFGSDPMMTVNAGNGNGMMGIGNGNNEQIELTLTRVRSLTNPNDKGPDVVLNVTMKDAFHKVMGTFFQSTIVIALPGVILNAILHFLQAIEIEDTFPMLEVTFYVFGFLVYLALQTTMVGVDVTRQLILLYVLIFGGIGTSLFVVTVFEELMNINLDIDDRGLMVEWWAGLLILYAVCECAARLKFIRNIRLSFLFGTMSLWVVGYLYCALSL